ncbi:Hypothetical predicted protein [Pelobates cultripes]|uniref:Uncharacterized protein n=1 Tax=Pelobates cultripes TaxID=61616 RepID=A0AAD1W1V9_PELCU|nr:Hypothetical predicted protein [Pelobates cultripes]
MLTGRRLEGLLWDLAYFAENAKFTACPGVKLIPPVSRRLTVPLRTRDRESCTPMG